MLSQSQRSELIACIEAGSAARGAGADHGANPHLLEIRSGSFETSQSHQIQRCEAWWDGWEEADRAIEPWRTNVEERFRQ